MDVAIQFQLQNIGWAIATVAFIIVGSLAVAYLASFIARLDGSTPAVQRRAFWGFLFASPWIIGFVIFVLGPALSSLYYSFTNHKLGDTPQWNGLDNYRQFILGEGAFGRRFKQALFNSFYYAIIGVPLQITAALALAMLLNQNLRGIRLFRLIFYTPVILAGGPAVLLAWRYMLASNGGFINTTLQNLAKSFFLFDWLYRGFIYAVEGFNGLFSGLSRGDPIGPFKYTIPALIAVLVLLTLVRGDWTPGKRERALRVAEIIGVVLILLLALNGLVADPVDPFWVLAIGLGLLLAVRSYLRRGQPGTARALQIVGLIGSGLTAAVVLTSVSPELQTGYLIALIADALALAASMVAPSRLKNTVILGASILFAGLLLVHIALPQFGDGHWQLPLQYMTFQSAIQQPDNLDYLNDVYPVATLSALWFYGALVALLVVTAVLNSRYERTRRYLLTISLAFFAVFMVGSLVDGIRYFNAYEAISVATGTPDYHFTLFRTSVATFPDNTRVPLWMTSELWSKPSLILITMWSSGAIMLIFLAALKGVPRQLYEAAEVDGATRIQRFFKITLPMISPALFYNVVIGMIAAMQTFEAIYILQTPQNLDSLRSAAFFLFERTFREQSIGQGASLSWILAIIIVTLTVMQFRYSRWVHYEV